MIYFKPNINKIQIKKKNVGITFNCKYILQNACNNIFE